MPIGTYGIINSSKILFTIILSIIFLGESLSPCGVLGSTLVILGIILVNLLSNKGHKEASTKSIIFALIACLTNSIFSIFDKILMQDMSSGQLQFWYMLMSTIIAFVLLFITTKKKDFKQNKLLDSAGGYKFIYRR